MVLMKMLMEIALSRWEEHWWWRWWWFPTSGGKYPRQNSSAGALDWIRQGSASWRRSLVPKSSSYFFSHRKTSYMRRCASESQQGAHEVGACPRGAPPTLVSRVWAPWPLSWAMIFLYFFSDVPWSFGTFGVAQNRSLIFAPFPAQNSSCRHSPSLCKPCKIRENSHKYCDITWNNNP